MTRHFAMDKGIIRWHVDTFPKATKTSQLLKVAEELIEWIASGFSLSEAADVYIAATSLQYRYKCTVGYWLRKKFESPILLEVVKGKMRINRTRVWYGNHHKDV